MSVIFTGAADSRRRGPKISAAATFSAPTDFVGGDGDTKNTAAAYRRGAELR